MKKLTAMLMVLVLLTLPFAGAETATPSLILSSANPLPEIYERVSPSVVSVVLTTTVWDAATDSVKTTEQGGACRLRERGRILPYQLSRGEGSGRDGDSSGGWYGVRGLYRRL